MKYIATLLLLSSTFLCKAQFPGANRDIPIVKDWQKQILKKKSLDIVDYYLILPDYLFGCELDFDDSKEARESGIEYKNIKNGYLKSRIESPMIVVMFKGRTKNEDIIALTRCGATCQCFELTFMKINEDRTSWTDATNILPSNSEFIKLKENLEQDYDREIMPFFDLPEYGTTIKVTDEFQSEDFILFYLKWNGNRFDIEPKK